MPLSDAERIAELERRVAELERLPLSRGAYSITPPPCDHQYVRDDFGMVCVKCGYRFGQAGQSETWESMPRMPAMPGGTVLLSLPRPT